MSWRFTLSQALWNLGSEGKRKQRIPYGMQDPRNPWLNRQNDEKQLNPYGMQERSVAGGSTKALE